MARLEEIEAVYRSAFPRFLRVAIAIVGEEQLGRDAVHDGFVRAVRYRRRVRGALEPWIWRIVVNEARKRRVRLARVVPTGSLEMEDPEPNGYHRDAALHAAVEALPERQRTVLFLRYFADLDYEAIADTLGIASGTVAATLNAAHSKLRTQLKEERCEV